MENRLNTRQNSGGQIIAITMLFSVVYVVFRYHIFGGVPWKDFPFFILNKVVSLSAFILLTFNFTFGPIKNMGVKVPAKWLESRSVLGMIGFVLVIIHIFMSLILLSPAVYAKFFEIDGTFTLLAGLSLLGGILAFVALWIYNLSFQTYLRENQAFMKFITSRKFLIWSLTFGAFHLFFMGFKGWINPAGWHGGMPPVSLVAFTFFVIGYVINLFGRK
ncbi:MAG: hypothetical protein L3J54_13930 [Draconibacterium sp.]|nr:hypothetical protein [Draconibacterium sp.]